MEQMSSPALAWTLVKRVHWYDYVVFAIWAVLLYLAADFSLTAFGEGVDAYGAGWVGLYFFVGLLLGVPLIRLGVHYLRRRK